MYEKENENKPRWPRKSSRPHAPCLRRGPGPGFGAQGKTIRCRTPQFDAETAQPDCEGTADLTPTSPCHLRCGSVCASSPKSGSSARRTFWGAACLPPSGTVSLSVAGRGKRRSEQGVWMKNEFMKRNPQHSTTKKNARSGSRERDTCRCDRSGRRSSAHRTRRPKSSLRCLSVNLK